MSEPIDVICKHEKVVRREDSWYCDWCEAKFYHLEDIGFSGQTLQVMEPYATLRDQFAMAALSGMLADQNVSGNGVEKFAYVVADAMLEARK